MRLVIAGTILFFVIFVMIRIFFDATKDFSPSLPDSQTMLFVVWVIISLFSLTFLFILIRNIIKLYYDNAKGQNGGRFKSKLVFFFIAFSIIPTLLLFFFATELINRGIEFWFSTDIDAIMGKTNVLKDSYYEKAKDDLKHFSNVIINNPKGIKAMRMYTYANKVYLSNYVTRQMINYRLDVVNVFVNQKEFLSRINPDIPLQEYKDLPLETIYKGLSSNEFLRVGPLKNGELIRSGMTFDTPQAAKVLVVTGKYFPDGTSKI